MTSTAAGLDHRAPLARRGDEQFLAEAFSQYRDRLRTFVFFRFDRRLRGRVDEDDVLQEAYLAAAERLHHYFDESSMSLFLWLRLIVGQTLVDVHRRHLGTQMRDARLEVSLNTCRHAADSSAKLADGLVGHLTTPSQAFARRETTVVLEQALMRMNGNDREILLLRHFEGLANGEVAEVLCLTQKAASIRYVRALKRLKAVLGEVPGFAEEISHGD